MSTVKSFWWPWRHKPGNNYCAVLPSSILVFLSVAAYGNCECSEIVKIVINWRLYCIFYYCLHYVNWQAQFQLCFFFLYSFSDFSHVFGRFSYVQCDSTEMKNISSGKCFHVWFCIKLWKKVVVALCKHVIGKLWFIFMLNINPILIHKDSNVTVHSMIPVICIALRFSLYSMYYSVWGFFFLSPCFLLCLFFPYGLDKMEC